MIQKNTRRELRKYQDQQTDQVLQEFADLNRIDGIHRTPVVRSEPPPQINPESFTDLLRQIYACLDDNIHFVPEAIKNIPTFDRTELLVALRRMANRRGADKSGIVVEMIKHGGHELHFKMLELYNNIITQGKTDSGWHETIFNMLPKSGD